MVSSDFPVFTPDEGLILSQFPGWLSKTYQFIDLCLVASEGTTNRPDLPVIALDDLRAEMEIDPADDQGAVVQAAKARARELLRRQQPFAWNATNITRSLRRQLVDLFTDYGARVGIVYVEAPYAELLARNQRRPAAAAVPEKVLQRLLRRLDVPDPTEAQRVEWVHQI